jgi:hypothetical protein
VNKAVISDKEAAAGIRKDGCEAGLEFPQNPSSPYCTLPISETRGGIPSLWAQSQVSDK